LTVLEESGSSPFPLFSDWLPYKTGRRHWKQCASRFFQNSENNSENNSVVSIICFLCKSQSLTLNPTSSTPNPFPLNPGLKNYEPSTLTLKLGILNPESWTLNPEPWILNPEPWTLNPEPWTLNPEPETLNPKTSYSHETVFLKFLSILRP